MMKKSWSIVVAAILFLHFPFSALYALPTGESVEAGSASFERPDPATLNIRASNGTVINFHDFSIAANEVVNFNPFDPVLSSSTNVLGRVSGASPSQLFGILNANLNLFLVNTNGIYFAPSSRVNANNFVASTLDISTNNFINGNYILQHKDNASYAQILNQGRITGDNIALVASAVQNAGMVLARAGSAHLASGNKVTVSFDQRGLIQVEINEATSGQVVDLNGTTVKDAVANSGTMEAREVVMSSKTASGIFENAVNQTGIVKATALTQEGGVIRIRADKNIQVSGTLEAPKGRIEVSSGESIAIKSELKTIGNTELKANKDIEAGADITTVDGDLSLIADADLDGNGSFRQAAGTLISTINYGNIIIQSSGQGTLANISSAEDLILRQGGAAVTFTQHPDSRVSAVGSMTIGQGVTVNAANALYRIGKDLINLGIFNPQNSLVELVSAEPAFIKGPITFNDFKVIVPGKKVRFSAGDTVTTLGVLTLHGSYGNLLTLVSTEPGDQWKILPLGQTDIVYSQIGDCFNARGPPLKATHSSSIGNNSNLDLDPYWTGQGTSSNWSDPDNWDSGTIPSEFDIVTFDGITGTNPNKNSFIDPDFNGTIANFTVNGYSGAITLQRDLTVTGDVSLQTGSFSAGSYTIIVGGDWSSQGDTFQAGVSTVVFNNSSRISRITGNTTFYKLTCLTPGKKLVFGAGTFTTVQDTFTIEGSEESHITLTSSIEAKGGEFGIYMAKVSDAQGNPYLEFLDVYYSIAYGPLIPVPAKHYYIPAELNIDWDDTHTWSGTASNLWNTGGVGGNWNGAVVPVAGDDLVFPAGLVSGRYATSNNIAAATSFNSIAIQGSGYTLAGNSITLGAGGLTDSTAAGGASTISLNIVLSATRTVTVTNAGTNLTISGLISGNTFGITKAGNGTLTLSGANTFTGAVTVTTGTLSVNAVANSGVASPLGTGAGTPAIGIAAAGILQYTGNGHSTNRNIAPSASGATIDASGTGLLTLTGGIGAGTAYNIVLNGTGTGSITTAIINTSTGTLTKNGTGTWTIGVANSTYSGTTTINAGTLKSGIANAFPTAAVTVNNTGIFDWNSFTDTIAALTVNDGGLVTCTGAGAILTISTLAINSGVNGGGDIATVSGTLTLGGNVTSTGGYTNALISGKLDVGGATRTITLTNAADGLAISAVISSSAGAYGITKAGNGTLTLSGANTFTGAVTITTGTLSVNAVANSGVASPLGTGAGTPAISIAAAGILQYTGNGHSTNRNIAPSASGATIDASGTDTLTLTGGIGTGVARNIVLTGTGTGNITITRINTSTGTLTKNGTGTWILTEANTYSGITTLNAGILSVAIMRNGGIASGIGSSPNAAANLILNGGIFQYIGGTSSTNRLFTIGTTSPVTIEASGTGTLTFTGASITLSGTDTARSITFTGTGSAVLTNVIPDNGAGATTVVKDGPGTWSFSGVNTYTGPTSINAGILKISADSGLGAAPAVPTPGQITFNGGTLQTTAIFTLDADRGIALAADGTISTDTVTTLTYAGIIDGSGAFVKDGEGTLILQGTNTYSSATTINNGTLTLSGANGSALNSPSFTINSEATLTLDNSTANNPDRIANTSDITMNGGNFNFTGNDTVSASETVGALNIAAGSNYVNVLDDTGGFTIMRISSFSRIPGAMVLFRGTDLGNSPSANVSTIMFTTAPVLTGGGGAAGTTTVSIIQGAFGSSSRSGTGTDMVTYNLADDPNGLRLLNGGGFSGEYESSALTVPNSNVKLSSSVAPGVGITINSLILASGGGVASSANTLTIGSGNILAFAGNAGINGTTVLAFGTGPAIIRTAGDLIISSQITGSGGLTKGGSGALTLSNAANNYTGDNRFSQGTVIISADADLGAGSGATNITLFGGTLRTTATFVLNSNRGIMLKGSATIFTDPATTLTYNGVISGPKSLTKDGTGALLLGGTNTYAGSTTVNAGALTMSGANSYAGATTINSGSLTFSGANGAAVNSVSFTINLGGTLTLDNSAANNTNRINDGSSIILNSGEFIFKGNNGASNAAETVGALTLSTGDSTVTVFSGTGGQAVLTFDSASRAAGTTVLFRGANLGANPGVGNTNIKFLDDTDLRLTGGGTAAGTTTISIVPYALGDTAVAGTGFGFVTHNIDTNNNTNGIRPLVLASEYDNTNTPVTSATLNVRLTASYSPNATRAWNCLILDGAGITYTIGTSNTRTLTLSTGAIFSSGTAAKTLAGSASRSLVAAASPANEFLIFTAQNLTITAPILNTNTPGLTKSGTGTLTLSSVAKVYSGMTTINEGTIAVGVAAAIGSTSSVTVGAAGTLAVGNFADTIASLTLYSGSTSAATVTTGTGVLTLGGNIILYVNGSGAVGGTISTTNTGSLALGNSRTITVNDGNASADLAISLPVSGVGFSITKQGDGTLTLSGNNSYSGGTILNSGTLNINSATALGGAAGALTIAAGTTIDNTSGGAITLTNNNPQVWNGDFVFTGSNNLSMGSGAVTMNADRVVTVSANTLTVGAINSGAYSLIKAGAGTLTLAGALTIKNLTISAGTLDVGAGNNAVNVAGNWSNSGIFNCRLGTVTFNGGSSTIDTGGTGDSQDFYSVIVNSTGTKTLSGAMMINNGFQVNAGVFAGDYDVTVKGGTVTGDGTINMTDGTFNVQGTGNFGNSTSAWTFYNLTFGDGATVKTTTKIGTNTINVTSTLAVALYHVLQAGNGTTWNLVWTSYLKNIIMIASGYDHTIALTDDGYVFSWGCNFYGQLGDGTTDDASRPVQVLSGEQGGGTYIHNISRISAGGYHSVALADDGSVFTWGYNLHGQLGDNTTANSSIPVQVHGVNNVGNLSGMYRVAAGGDETAAISTTGFVFCWGYNEQGELGNNSTADSLFPVQVLSGEQGGGTYLHNISRVSVGGAHVIALDTGGYVYAWGFNEDGELGNTIDPDPLLDSHVPVRVLSGEQGGTYLHDITQISAGDSHSLAIDISGFVYSWGYNSTGQLGDGTTTDRHTPVHVLSGEQTGTYLHNVTRVSAGGAHSLAIADGGFVFSWGQNHGPSGELWGQLGNGKTIDSSLPVQVLSGEQSSTDIYLQGIAEIAAGGAQTVALSASRPVFNCGNNANGQLGKGDFTVGAVDQIRVQAGSQAGPVIQLVVSGTLNNQTAIINIYLSAVRYTDLTISNNHQANYWLSGNTIVSGNLVINNATLNAGTYDVAVSGNWTNTGGTFNPGTGTVTLNSSTQTQSITSGGSAFNILTITNTYSGGVAFVDRLVTAYLNAGSGVKKLSFSAASLASPHTITSGFNVNGSAGSLIELAPLVGSTTWYIDAPTSSLHYLKVGFSHEADGKTLTAADSQDATGNSNWNITP
jgi:filamentous hemagglutinin family protein